MTELGLTGGRCFEDFTVGLVMRHPLGRTVTATDNIWSSLTTVNTNPIHFDAHYSSQTEFGRPLVNSCFTLALVTGLSVADVSRNAFNLGWDEVRMPNPVFEGDTIYSRSEILETRVWLWWYPFNNGAHSILLATSAGVDSVASSEQGFQRIIAGLQ